MPRPTQTPNSGLVKCPPASEDTRGHDPAPKGALTLMVPFRVRGFDTFCTQQ